MVVLDKFLVAHAGLKEAYPGRASGRVRSYALYGEATGETGELHTCGIVAPCPCRRVNPDLRAASAL